MKKGSIVIWFAHIAIAIIVIAFFVISHCGFFMGDDIGMSHGVTSISDVFKHTMWWYYNLGGRFFSVAAQYLFCGLLKSKIWFDIINTLFFVLLITVCGNLVKGGRNGSIRFVLLFTLLFWLFCPMPDETLFWVAGSTTHMWGNTLVFVFIALYFKYKDVNFGIIGKFGLFMLSVFAATEFLPCASICGAFVVYYAFHIKRFKGNVVPFVVGFVIGSMFLLFAPGNFERATELEPPFADKIKELIFNPIQEIIKYKALWMFLVVLVLGWIKNRMAVKTWMKNNAFLLLSLGWSVVAFGVVFRPANRALFFPETISIVLFLRFLYDNYEIFGIRFLETIFGRNNSMARNLLITLLFVVFLVDATFAVAETKKQSKNNDVLLNEIADSGGIVALDQMISSHRMAYVPGFPNWTWEPLADRFGLDSVHVYPYYCQDKFYKQTPPLDNVYIDEINYNNDNDVFGKYIRLIVRVENGDLQERNNHVVFTIDYTRPKKWYKSWLDKLRSYRYDRTEFVERDNPDVCFNGYCYYVIWFGRENAKNLKSVEYDIDNMPN